MMVVDPFPCRGNDCQLAGLCDEKRKFFQRHWKWNMRNLDHWIEAILSTINQIKRLIMSLFNIMKIKERVLVCLSLALKIKTKKLTNDKKRQVKLAMICIRLSFFHHYSSTSSLTNPISMRPIVKQNTGNNFG